MSERTLFDTLLSISMWTKNFLHDQTNWWYCHLYKTVTRGCDEDYDYNSLLEKVFKVTEEDSNRYWRDTMNMNNEYGCYPQIHFGLPEGHVVSVVYWGEPRYEVQYRYGTPTGESYLIAAEDAQGGVLPGFRWAEVKAISSLVPHISNLALLSLLPAADVSADEKTEAESEIQRALIELGFDSPDTKQLAERLVDSLHSKSDYWFYDESYGWITNDNTCWRHVNRNETGLTSQELEFLSPPEFFSDFKNFTGFLKLNKSN
jgi:hypothetical protein